MKYGKYLVGGIALAMLAATPVYAQEGGSEPVFAIVGDVWAGVRILNDGDDGDGERGSTELGIDVKASIPIYAGFTGQLDARYESYDSDSDAVSGEDDMPESLTNLGVHLSYRDPSTFLVGLFYGYGMVPLVDNPPDYEVNYYGIEGQYYLENVTLYGQYAMVDSTQDDPSEVEGYHDGWLVRVAVRWFPSDDTRLGAEMSYGETDTYVDSSDPGEFRAWGINGRTRIAASVPLYLTGDYRNGMFDATEGEDDGMNESVFMLGISYQFGPGTLKSNDRRGATLDLPVFATRAHGFAEILD